MLPQYIEFTSEEEAILDEVWAEIARERGRREAAYERDRARFEERRRQARRGYRGSNSASPGTGPHVQDERQGE